MSAREILYNRSKTLYDHAAIPRLHVIGVGGVGGWTAIQMAIAGVPEIHVYDDDDLAFSNLGRLPFSVDDVGKPKTQVVKAFVERCRPDAVVVCHPAVSGREDLVAVQDGDLIVVAVDSAASNNLVLDALEGRRVRILRGAYDGDRIVVMDAVPQWDASDSPQGGYEVVPSYLVPPAIVAALLVEKAFRRPDLNINSMPVGDVYGKIS